MRLRVFQKWSFEYYVSSHGGLCLSCRCALSREWSPCMEFGTTWGACKKKQVTCNVLCVGIQYTQVLYNKNGNMHTKGRFRLCLKFDKISSMTNEYTNK